MCDVCYWIITAHFILCVYILYSSWHADPVIIVRYAPMTISEQVYSNHLTGQSSL